MGHPLFVYGTLQRGESRAGLVRHLTAREARTRGTLYHLPAGYPGLLPTGPGWVHGELLEPADERLLQILDTYEGVDQGLYERVVLPISVGLRPHRAWVYVLPGPPREGRVIADGRWHSRRRS